MQGYHILSLHSSEFLRSNLEAKQDFHEGVFILPLAFYIFSYELLVLRDSTLKESLRIAKQCLVNL